MNRPIRWILALLALATMLSASGCSGGGSSSPDLDGDGVNAISDCDDTDPTVADLETYFVDSDEDGIGGATTEAVCASSPPVAFSLVAGDCDDGNANIQSPAGYFVDQDLDGVGGPLQASLCESSAPAGYSVSEGDCNDQDPNVTEDIPYFIDSDADGFGVGSGQPSCLGTAPVGFASASGDPDDGDSTKVPGDLDGDGVGNEIDCAPNDGSAWALNLYYDDVDLDGIGVNPVEFCTAIPAPEIYRHAFVGGDECPFARNREIDLDADGLDDACDLIVHFQTDQTFQNEALRLPETARVESGSERIEYRIGSEGNPVTLRFESSSVTLMECGLITLHGGSSLIFETTSTDSPALLRMGIYSSCETDIVGAPPADKTLENTVRFVGARLDAGRKLRFRSLHTIIFEPASIEDAAGEATEYGSRITYAITGIFSQRTHDLTVSDSVSAHAALVVNDQFVDLGNIRFVNNANYPVECVGRDYRVLEGARFPRGGYTPSATCALAMYRSYFEGNGRGGPLLSVSVGQEPSICCGNLYGRPFLMPVLPDRGTNIAYIRRFDLSGTETATFNDVELRPYVTRDPSYSGEGEAPDLIDPDVEIYLDGFTAEAGRPSLGLFGSFARDIPIRGAGRVAISASNTTLGPVLLDSRNLAPDEYGPYLQLDNATIDLAGSAFQLGIRDFDPGVEVTTAGVVLDNLSPNSPGGVQVLVPLRVISDATTDSVILNLTEQFDPDGPVNVDLAPFVEGVVSGSLVRTEEPICCGSNLPTFELK